MTTEPTGTDVAPSPDCYVDPSTNSLPSLSFIWNAACAGKMIIDDQGDQENPALVYKRLYSVFNDIQDELSCQTGSGNREPFAELCSMCRKNHKNDPDGYMRCKANCNN